MSTVNSIVQVSTDTDEIAEVLDTVVFADPVRGTVLGTIRLGLTGSAWAAWHTDASGAVVGAAARAGADYPLAITGGWDAAALAGLTASLRDLDDLVGVTGDETVVDTVLAVLDRVPVSRERQCLFRLDDLVPPTVAGAPLRAGEVHRQLARGWFAAFGQEVHDIGSDLRELADRTVDAGLCWLWVDPDGTPVALAARRPVLAGSGRIGPVYTPPAQRGNGWASGLTAAVAQTILDEGAVPVLFTDLDNPTSNKIYQALGFTPVENRVVVTLRR